MWDFSRDGVLRSLEQSLVRLGLDRVDVVFIHDPDDHWDDAIGQAYPALEELRRQGVVSSIGAGMNQAEMLADFVRQTDIDIVMLAGRYTLLDQDAFEDLLPLCVERKVGVVAAGVFNSGVLAADAPPETRGTTMGQRRPQWSSAPASPTFAGFTASRFRRPRSPIRSPILPSSESASVRARPNRSLGISTSTPRGPCLALEALSSAGLLPDEPPDR